MQVKRTTREVLNTAILILIVPTNGFCHSGTSKYSEIETLRDGLRVEVRALRPNDKTDFLAAVARTSAESLRRRFVVSKTHLYGSGDRVLSKCGFYQSLSLVAVVQERGRPVVAGGGRYIVVRPGEAEIAFAVIDDYESRGVGGVLIRHLTAIAQAAGLQKLIAEVLAENIPMLRLLEKSGLCTKTRREVEFVRVTLQLS